MVKYSAFRTFVSIGFFTALSLLISCNGQVKNSIIDIKDSSTETIKASDMFESIKYVPLETTGQSKVSEISEVLFYKGVYVFLDSKQKTLMGFDQKGKFLFKISPTGNGPLKISGIADYTINKKDDCIDVYDITQNKIVSFDFNGEAKSEKTVDFVFNEFASASTGDYVVYAQSSPNNSIEPGGFIIDSKGKFKKSFLKIQVEGAYTQPVCCLSGFGDSISLVSNYSNEIYVINKEKINKRYTLETAKDWGQSLILANGSGSLLNFLYRKNSDDPKSASVFLNSYTGKEYHIDNLMNDLFLLPMPIPYLFKDSSALVAFIDPQAKNQLLELVGKQEKTVPNFDKSIVSELKNLLKSLKTSDNMVVVELHTKI